jgi:hypothetical protein
MVPGHENKTCGREFWERYLIETLPGYLSNEYNS